MRQSFHYFDDIKLVRLNRVLDVGDLFKQHGPQLKTLL